ncbi:MAG: neutral zinc metallopeptidase [Acidimicrobiales bacterium]
MTARRAPSSRTRRHTWLAAVLASAVALAACGSADQGVTARRSDQQTPSTDDGPGPDDTTPATDPDSPLEPTEDTTPPPTGEPIIDFGTNHSPQPYDNFLNAAFQDITDWWTEEFPALYGGTFQPVSGIYALYPERADLPPSCDGPVPYEAVEGNAFYTDCGDIIVYDDALLLPDLVDRLGAAAVGVVAAHEYGHAIQARAGVFDLGLPTVDTEQQADCFAGAWAAHVALGESDLLSFDDTDVKSGIIAMIEVRDPVGSDVLDASGHGTGFDRVGAFQEGFINGPTRCADFPNNPNPRIDLVFNSEEDFQTGGNLPYDEILADLPVALDTFWQPTLDNANVPFTAPTLVPFQQGAAAPACDGQTADQLTNQVVYCAANNTIVYDEAFVQDLYARLGDLSFGFPIAEAYSDAVQVALQSQLSGEKRVLLNDCLVGAWIVDIVPVADAQGNLGPRNPNQQILLSAGDLDEAVITAVALGDEASNTDVRGTAFEKIDSFRAGVLGGLDACQQRIG